MEPSWQSGGREFDPRQLHHKAFNPITYKPVNFTRLKTLPLVAPGLRFLSPSNRNLSIVLMRCTHSEWNVGFWQCASLGVCPRIRICRVASAAWADTRRRDAGNAVSLSRSANEADAQAPPQHPCTRRILILGQTPSSTKRRVSYEQATQDQGWKL
jgi:hypothetical protein